VARADTGDLEFTGERCVPGAASDDVFYEHMHRYLLARTVTAGRDVIDLGSGEGYGSALLAESANSVVGVDTDAASIAHARSHYARSNLRFLQASAIDIPELAEASFDVAVCFEMIEHISQHDELLINVKRLLRPDGLLVISSPDRDVYTTDTYHNPFHVRELSRDEFKALLAKFFQLHVLYSQTFSAGSRMSQDSEPSATATFQDFVGHRSEAVWTSDETERLPYLVAVASDRDLPPLPSVSHLHDSRRELLTHAVAWQGRAAEADVWKARAHEWEASAADWKNQAQGWQLRHDAVVTTGGWQRLNRMQLRVQRIRSVVNGVGRRLTGRR
jgi:SAM-dependent methyltransferase